MAKRLIWRGFVALFLTALSFVGGVCYLFALLFKRRRIVWFALSYAVLSIGLQVWQGAGRVPVMQASAFSLRTPMIYTVLNRNWVTPDMRDVARDLAAHVNTQYPGTRTLALDGNFPAFDWMPLLPHLSHNDGEKLDFGLYWKDETGAYVAGESKSPLGYWGYAEGPSFCPKRWADLRWDFEWLQSRLPNYSLDDDRTRAALEWLIQDERVAKILVEPHIAEQLGLKHPKIRFQGCRAARHDDHIHIQL